MSFIFPIYAGGVWAFCVGEQVEWCIVQQHQIFVCQRESFRSCCWWLHKNPGRIDKMKLVSMMLIYTYKRAPPSSKKQHVQPAQIQIRDAYATITPFTQIRSLILICLTVSRPCHTCLYKLDWLDVPVVSILGTRCLRLVSQEVRAQYLFVKVRVDCAGHLTRCNGIPARVCQHSYIKKCDMQQTYLVVR